MSDKFEGMGGSYLINQKTGARTLVSRTEDAPPDPPTITEIIAPTEPANTGFFTPVAPAEPTTTE